ncbi:MAG: LLM class F420-dependent oxidoreductase [Actinobacteria bacterium]|nr:LLM class F420-dependent oxidoreductase [Actinomycetota bacterium]
MAGYGISIPFEGIDLADQAGLYAKLADLGYTDVWSSEASGYDAFAPLAQAALAPGSLRLGTAIVPVFTRGPATLAMSAASISAMAPGRFALGLGSSSDVIVNRWNGIAFDRPYQRVRDTLRFLRRALAGEKVTAEYETFSVAGFRLDHPPEVPPPILLGALRPGMLRLAGREGDGAIVNWLGAGDVPRVAAEVGPGKEIVARIFCAPTEDSALARSVGRQLVAAYLNVEVYARFHEWLGRGPLLGEMWDAWRAGDRKRAVAAIPDIVVDDLIVHGSAEVCQEHISRYVKAGVTTPVLAVLPLTADPWRVIEDLSPS